MPSACGSLIAHFPAAHTCRVVMSDWLSTEQLSRAAVLWVVDDSEPWDAIRIAFRNGIPLLVPDSNRPLKYICLNANCGLFYRDMEEAAQSLALLLTNDELRSQLGANGRVYVP